MISFARNVLKAGHLKELPITSSIVWLKKNMEISWKNMQLMTIQNNLDLVLWGSKTIDLNSNQLLGENGLEKQETLKQDFLLLENKDYM